MATIKRKTVLQVKVLEDSKILNLPEVSVFERTAQVLFDSGAIPNMTAADIRSQQHLQPHSTNIRIRIADRFNATVLGEIDKVPFIVVGVTHSLTVSVVNNGPFRPVIGRPAMKSMRASLEFDEDISIVQSRKQAITVPLCTDNKTDGHLMIKEIILVTKDDTDNNSREESGPESNT